MRRIAVTLALATLLLLVSTPAHAFAHDKVTNPWLHLLLDAASLAVVAAPLFTVLLWGRDNRGLMLALMAVVQLPVAIIAFNPLADPVAHAATMVGALLVTMAAILAVRLTASTTAARRTA